MTKIETAMLLHDKGYNCCQSVACSFYKEVGVDEVTIFKAAEGFGLGMGCGECTCGGLTGAIMVAGFKNSTANLEGDKSKKDTYKISEEMVNAFREKNGSILCKDLKGTETTPPVRTCAECICDGVEIVEKFLKL